MTATMMVCGHAANGYRMNVDGTRTELCVICAGIGNDEGSTPAPAPDLTGRMARCTYTHGRDGKPCRRERPSSLGGSLAFFRHLPDQPYDEWYCGCWGWN